MPSKVPFLALAFFTLAYLGFGFWVLFNPEAALEAMSLSWSNDDGRFELISNYAGLNIGAGLISLLGLLKKSIRQPALMVPMALNGGYVFGRAILTFQEGLPGTYVLAAWGFELFALVLAFVAFRKSHTKKLFS